MLSIPAARHLFLDSESPSHPMSLPIGIPFDVVSTSVVRTSASLLGTTFDEHTFVHFVKLKEN